MPLVRTTSGKEFPIGESESLLDAALNADVVLDYSCRTGRCSTCKATVDSGATATLHDELGLTAEERAAGWILTCVRTATEDVTLRVDDLGSIRLPRAKTVPCRINNLELVAPDVLQVTLRLPPTAAFDFLPGQYIEVIGPGGVRRSYSLANAPRNDQTLELHIRQVDGGALSAYWFDQAAPNDLLRIYGPLGTFFLRDAGGTKLCFLATGTGIAPVKSILGALAQAPDAGSQDVSVYWGGRTEQDLYWSPPPEWPSHWRFVRVLSRADDSWRGARGYVQSVMSNEVSELGNASVYACGSELMIHDAMRHLVARGLDERRYYSDAFVSSAPA